MRKQAVRKPQSLRALIATVPTLIELGPGKRRKALAELLPDLARVVDDQTVDPHVRLRLVTQALRVLRLGAERPADAAAGLATLRELLEQPVGPGQPPVGPAMTVRLQAGSYPLLDQEARRRGLVDKHGAPNRAGLVRAIVERALLEVRDAADGI